MELITEEHINNLLSNAILGEGKKNKNQEKTVGSQEETIKAYNKASRDAEQEEHGGVLAFQHKQVTKNKKDKQSRQDCYSRKCKHKGNCSEGVAYEIILKEGDEDLDLDMLDMPEEELDDSVDDGIQETPEQEYESSSSLPSPEEAMEYAQKLWKICVMHDTNPSELPAEYDKVFTVCNMIAQAIGYRI